MTADGRAAPPRVWSVSMVRNEVDIVEAFVRHNATVLDGMAILDHGSADGTLEIVTALAREGLPVRLVQSAVPGYLQEEITTSLAREVFLGTGADYVLPLDADEFLKVASRTEFGRALRSIPEGMHGLLRWLTYVPAFRESPRGILAILKGARRVPEERHVFHKALMSRALLDNPDAMLSNGNHYVASTPHGASEDAKPHARIRDRFAAVAHVPIRSPAQFVSKVAIKKLGRIAANNDWRPEAASQAAYEAIVAGGSPDPALLLEHAVNWSVQRERWIPASSVELVDDPFLATFELRHTPPEAADPVPLVLAAAERMTRRLAMARSAGGPGRAERR